MVFAYNSFHYILYFYGFEVKCKHKKHDTIDVFKSSENRFEERFAGVSLLLLKCIYSTWHGMAILRKQPLRYRT